MALALIFAALAFPDAALARKAGDAPTLAQLTPTRLTPNTCSSAALAPPFVAPASDYRRKHNTLAHRLLDDESGAGQVTPNMYAILDVLIDEAVASLAPYRPELPAREQTRFAVATLRQIDCILLRHGFVYPGHGAVQLVSDGLAPTMYERPDDLAELKRQSHNVRRAKFIAARGKGPFYVVDCDIAAFIYLAIAEVQGYPLHLVDIPTHNFVRWKIGPDAAVDFETMDGAETNDAFYRAVFKIPDAFVGKGGILRSMSETEVLAFHDAAVAGAWSWRGDVEQMIKHYVRSTERDSIRTLARNNLAWFYAAIPDVAKRDGAKAVQYGLDAANLLPHGDNLDTLACAYAQSGDFEQALRTEANADRAGYLPFKSNLASHIRLFRRRAVCNDAGYGKDPAPFRPGAGEVARATQ